MRAFVDTSSLFKKYIQENGSDQLDELLNNITEIAVSPVTWTEMNSIFVRRLREKSITPEQATWLQLEVERDFRSFHRVIWNDALEKKSVEIIRKLTLKTLDSIQLAAGVLSKADLFVTSDRKLFEKAGALIKKIRFI